MRDSYTNASISLSSFPFSGFFQRFSLPVGEVRAEDVEGLGKDVVVDEAGVDGEEGHLPE
jgi:hypothetical protein